METCVKIKSFSALKYIKFTLIVKVIKLIRAWQFIESVENYGTCVQLVH